MISHKKYIILNNICVNLPENTELCIINFNIINYFNYIKRLIESNTKTTFWAVTDNYSKEYVLSASKLGISNLIQFPINTDLIDNFFRTQSEFKENTTLDKYKPLNHSKIMIVDDNKLNIVLLEEILSDIGAEVKSYQNPIEAINCIEYEKYDLFLLDILMPELSGFELADIIRNSSYNNDSKIVFISAVSGYENKINGYNSGACSYIDKPFSPSVVKAQIYNLLKTNEAQKEKEKEKEGFVATLTHDLKSPINAEISALKYILKKADELVPKNKNEIINQLLNSAQYMKLITDKILCHYKQKSGKIKLHKEITSFNSIIESSIEEIKYLAKDKNIELRYLNNTVFNQIYVDFIEIKRVIINLISNGIEYSYPNSHIDILLDTLDEYCKFTIQDYGIGIDLKKYTKIFDEYETLSNEHKKIGFGLGLNISQKILKAHNSELSIESIPNYGTKISFNLKLAK